MSKPFGKDSVTAYSLHILFINKNPVTATPPDFLFYAQEKMQFWTQALDSAQSRCILNNVQANFRAVLTLKDSCVMLNISHKPLIYRNRYGTVGRLCNHAKNCVFIERGKVDEI